jgi:hypothetical protein
MPKFFRSRLVKKEEARSLRKTLFFSGLSILLILALIFLGIPSLVKIAIFFSEIKGSSTPVEQSDLLPPAPPKITSLPWATNTSPISLSGFAEAGSTVEIFLNETSAAKVTSTQEGTYTIDNLNLAEGKNEIYAVAQDVSGNKSQPSQKITTLFDKTPPELTINEPADKTSFVGEKQRKMKISGKTEPDVDFLVNGHLEVLDKDGNFALSTTLTEGENIFKFEAQDSAGNKTEKEIKVTFSP